MNIPLEKAVSSVVFSLFNESWSEVVGLLLRRWDTYSPIVPFYEMVLFYFDTVSLRRARPDSSIQSIG